MSVVGRVSSTTPHDDDARSDSSGEVTVIMDSADLASLSDAHKVMYVLYFSRFSSFLPLFVNICFSKRSNASTPLHSSLPVLCFELLSYILLKLGSLFQSTRTGKMVGFRGGGFNIVRPIT